MERATTGLWIATALILLIIGGVFVVVTVRDNPTVTVIVDLIWKVLVLYLLWDISAKLGRGRNKEK